MRAYGIDVLVFHPSPVATRFYDKVRAVHFLSSCRDTALQCLAPAAGAAPRPTMRASQLPDLPLRCMELQQLFVCRIMSLCL